MTTHEQTPLRVATLPPDVRREIARRNTRRGMVLSQLFHGNAHEKVLLTALKQHFPEVDWDARNGQPKLPQPQPEPNGPAPLPLAPPLLFPDIAPEKLPPQLRDRPAKTKTDWPSHTNERRAAVLNALEENEIVRDGRIDDRRISVACDIAYNITLTLGRGTNGRGGQQPWFPDMTLRFLVGRGLVSGDPVFIERTHIRYADPVKLREARTARRLTAPQLSERVKDLTGIDIAPIYYHRAENLDTAIFGDRLTATALVLQVPEDELALGGPDLTQPLSPMTDTLTKEDTVLLKPENPAALNVPKTGTPMPEALLSRKWQVVLGELRRSGKSEIEAGLAQTRPILANNHLTIIFPSQQSHAWFLNHGDPWKAAVSLAVEQVTGIKCVGLALLEPPPAATSPAAAYTDRAAAIEKATARVGTGKPEAPPVAAPPAKPAPIIPIAGDPASAATAAAALRRLADRVEEVFGEQSVEKDREIAEKDRAIARLRALCDRHEAELAAAREEVAATQSELKRILALRDDLKEQQEDLKAKLARAHQVIEQFVNGPAKAKETQ